MLRRFAAVLSLIALPALGLSACDDDVSGPGDGQATMSVLLTDAPGAVDEVWVDIGEVAAIGEPVESPDGRTLASDVGLVELTELEGTAEEIASAELQPGTYSQIRLVVRDAYLLTDDGRVFGTTSSLPDTVSGRTETETRDGTLLCPSCAQSGLKIVIGGSQEFTGENGAVLLDFDVSESFGREAGQSGMWVMNPTITGVRLADAASIEGAVTVSAGAFDGCAAGGATDFVPQAENAETGIVQSGSVSESGGSFSYEIDGLAPGDYAMTFAEEVELADGGTLTFSASDVETPGDVTGLGAGATRSGVDYTIQSVTSCPEAASGGS